MIRRAIVHRRNRRRLATQQLPGGGLVHVTPTRFDATHVNLSYDQPVVVSGAPHFTVNAIGPTATTIISATVVRLTFAADPATKPWVQFENDSAVRGFQGGTVAAAAGTFP
jgi:hypothetical protein